MEQSAAKLEPMRKKPAEYYEVNYNVALCLYLESQKTGDKSKALDAQQVLNAQFISSPKLDGPDTVARYKELLRKLAAGRSASEIGSEAACADRFCADAATRRMPTSLHRLVLPDLGCRM